MLPEEGGVEEIQNPAENQHSHLHLHSKVSMPMLESPVCSDRNSRSRTNLASDDGRLNVTISRETKELDNLLYLLLDKHKTSPPHPLPAGHV